ncbi:MAG: WXG100 family type VII secretion target, partial [Ktedonobacteraceae bacterium]|nr:WXG100 family type VII secretion target [Ktedonobacteraceae bacterium]
MSDLDNLAYLAGQLHQGAKKFSDAAQKLRTQAQQLDWSAEDLASGVDAWAGPASKSFQSAWQRYHSNTKKSADALDATSQALTKLAKKIDDSVDQMRAAQAAQTASSWLTVGLVVVDVVQLGLDPVTDAATVGMAGADVAAAEGADAAAAAIVEADAEIGTELEGIVSEIENVDGLGDIPEELPNEPGAIDFSEEDPEAGGSGGGGGDDGNGGDGGNGGSGGGSG